MRIEWLADIPASTYSLKSPPESGPFPTSELKFDVEPETIPACEEVFAALHRSRNILRTLRNIQRSTFTIETIDFSEDTNQSASHFEFEVENYYLRVPTVLEQVYELIGVLCEVDYRPGIDTVQRFEKLIFEKEPELRQILTQYKHSTRAIKNMRNMVAHLGEFVDDEYDTIGAFAELPTTATLPFVLEWLQAYREHFLATCESQLNEMVAFLDRVLDVLLIITRARYTAEERPDRTIMLRRATAQEEANVRQGLRRAR